MTGCGPRKACRTDPGSHPQEDAELEGSLTMKRSVHYGVLVLALIVLSVLCSLGLGRFGYTMVLPSMQQAMDLTNLQTGQMQSWNLVGYMLAVAIAGMLASRYGPRAVISIALFVVAGSMILTGLVPRFGAACTARFLTGLGGAAVNVPAMGLVSAWFAAERRGLASGIGVTGSSLGLIVAGPLVPFLLARCGPDGWRVCWGLFGGITLVVGLLCSVLLRNRPSEVGLLPVGGTARSAATAAPGSSPNWGSVYRSRQLWHLATVYFAFGFSYIIYSTFFAKHLVRELGMTTAEAGRLWLQVGLVSTVSGFAWGVFSDRWGRRTALISIFVLQGISFLLFGLVATRTGAYVSAALFAATAWSIPAVMAALAGDIFGPRLAPAALGLVTIVFGAGQALGPYIGGWLADTRGSFAVPFALAGCVALVLGAGGGALLRRPSAASPDAA